MPLSDARGDIDFPPKLQLVLNNALSRSAAERYQNAADFGHDTMDAVAGMPMPSTRVQTAHEGATAIMSKDELTQATKAQSAPATRKKAAPARDTGPTAVPASRKQNTGLIVGGGVGVIAVIAAVAVIMSKSGASGAAADSTVTPGQIAQIPPGGTTTPSDSQKSGATTTSKRPNPGLNTQTHTTPNPPPNNPPPPNAVANWSDTLKAANDAFDNDQLGDARRIAQRVWDHVSGSQKTSVAILIANTYSSSRPEEAIRWFRNGLPTASATQRTSIENLLRGLGQEP
jgi:hypothetical protein